MKKIYYLLPLIAALVTACGSEKQKQEVKQFTLNGKFANDQFNGKSLFLQSFDYDSEKYVDVDTVTVANGSFTVTHPIDTTTILYVSGEGIAKPQMFVGEVGTIEMTFDTTAVASARGTALNTAYQEYMDKRNSLNEKMREVSKLGSEAEKEKKFTPEYEKELDDKYNALYEELRNYTFNFVKTNVNNPVGEHILLDRGRSFDLAQLEEIVPLLSKSNTSKFKKIETRLNALKTTAVGQKFVDIKAQTPDGKEIALSEYAGKGKYVLVDFWASWCPPCRKEMPEVVKIYNQYKNKGFEIVGVSLDSKKEDWEKGIKDLKITWPQMSDLKYWNSEPSAAYAVSSIPHMVLLDKEGKIIARGITAHELAEKLKELL